MEILLTSGSSMFKERLAYSLKLSLSGFPFSSLISSSNEIGGSCSIISIVSKLLGFFSMRGKSNGRGLLKG